MRKVKLRVARYDLRLELELNHGNRFLHARQEQRVTVSAVLAAELGGRVIRIVLLHQLRDRLEWYAVPLLKLAQSAVPQ